MTKTFETKKEAETEELGFRLGKMLKAGDTVALYGQLGAGKTHFTAGIARSLEINTHITSPTYTIVNEYHDGLCPLFHFDAYRLSSADELFDIGFEDYLARESITVIEWAENIDDALPVQTIKVLIQRHDGDDENRRTIEIVFPEGDARNDDTRL